MFDLTRREWMASVLSLAGAGLTAQLPPGFGTPAPPPCDPSTKPTPARKPVEGQTGAPGAKLSLEGFVIGIRCGVLSGAGVTAWVGDSRVTVKTDANGHYTLNLVLPKVASPRVNLRIDVPKSAKTPAATLTTHLFLPGGVAPAELDPHLTMKVINRSADAIRASFNVFLDL
jgi:protocatechuate 3,4-dioxygenase beta subunit